jgi:hypothetical protein
VWLYGFGLDIERTADIDAVDYGGIRTEVAVQAARRS